MNIGTLKFHIVYKRALSCKKMYFLVSKWNCTANLIKLPNTTFASLFKYSDFWMAFEFCTCSDYFHLF